MLNSENTKAQGLQPHKTSATPLRQRQAFFGCLRQNGDMKSHTSEQLKKMIKEHPQESRKEWMAWMMERAGKKNGNNSHWQFWQQHNKPLEIKGDKMYAETVWYIHQNPVVSGFIYEAEQWVYSSAKGYAKNDGMIKLAEC